MNINSLSILINQQIRKVYGVELQIFYKTVITRMKK